MKCAVPNTMPKRATYGSAGYDFVAPKDFHIKAGEWIEIDTGVRFTDTDSAMFNGRICGDWCMLLLPRSSYGMKYGFRLANTIGLIDKDYRDTIKMKVTADVDMDIKEGDRIMQGIVIPYCTFDGEIRPKQSRKGGIGSTNAKENELDKDLEKYGLKLLVDIGDNYVSKDGYGIFECNDCRQLYVGKTDPPDCPVCGSSNHHCFEKGKEYNLIDRLKKGDGILEWK